MGSAKSKKTKVGKTEDIIQDVLLNIKPSKEEEKKLAKLVDSILTPLNKELAKIGAVAVIGGSGAKKTWLSGNHDLDVFVKFDCEHYMKQNSELSNLLEIVLRKVFAGKNLERVHGSRDYFNLFHDKFIIEIVPVLDIRKPEDALNITDVSPMHAEWVSWMVSKNKGIEDQIRLTKAFCRANNIYGAESYILGFSGYICEILTIYYGSFIGLLENAKSWQLREIVDPRKHYKDKAEVHLKVNADKLRSPIVIIDPVQKDRNAAAALSKEKFDEFRRVAKGFLENPSVDFFKKKVVSKEMLIKKVKKTGKDQMKNQLFVIYASPLKGKRDVVGSKLLKVFEFIESNFKRNEFKIIEKGWQWSGKDFADEKNDAMMWFIVPDEELSEKVKRMGPPVSAKEFFEDFKAAHKDIVIENKRAYAFVKRTHRTAGQLLETLKKDNYIKDRVKNIRLENEK